MTLQALVLSGSIPPPDHIGIPSGVSHGLSPCCSLTTTFPLFYHSASPAFFALTVFKASHHPTWDQVISVDGFAMSIDVEDRNRTFCLMLPWFPQRSGPGCQRFC